MKEIFAYFRHYYRTGNKKVWIITTLVLSVLVFLNYAFDIEPLIKSYKSPLVRLGAFFLLYAFVLTISYSIQLVFAKDLPLKRKFVVLLLLCPLLFAIKVSVNISYFFAHDHSSQWTRFWQLVLNWPAKCLLILSAIYAFWTSCNYEKPVAGMNRNFNVKPYLQLLLCAVPLIAVASAMNDFQHTYPKVKNIFFIYPYTQFDTLYKLLFELSYGTDFLTIEVFFRGFLVLAFARYVGKDAILPMAAFYCTVHFGKPLFECITSYIGGAMLGIIVYNTRSIWGGLIVHLGMAWLMELFTLIFANSN